MGSYNLDESRSLLNLFSNIKPSKLIKKGDHIELKHFNMFDFINATVLDISDGEITLLLTDSFDGCFLSTTDPVVLNFMTENDMYVISGEISLLETLSPIEVSIKIKKVEDRKNLRKYERFYVSMIAGVKAPGSSEEVFAVVKNISLGGVKFNSHLDVSLKDIVDVTLILDQSRKVSFKGVVVRKSELSDLFEYGVEICEINKKDLSTLHSFIG
ncbi:MAG: PilZ domain-containing protein [Clostridia bacterium]|nr:PilZ domain-containing protein [Clostridia bacterium]